ncbi:Putative aminopeptidase OS=Singulisphaera acidiphila (strain ATCC BAA-1392 / DSM 18658 / VKM B-2454 / MOB10) GN=Sinac_5126 PE=4 SV=1: Peptidase_M28 [Gemmataceae bacterium]|nr:Putative aminopeptidase OS=Singulisphaera acidiphila (strain ATCC BAA-1392 / DSM 18658 / VKM B-2454 / MOB10) GN=Sinac_5126 PE=4 SV=1: Peptidase_M28 [Gemmataceae bacterium]VTT99092.1 Putative aminopeptidase OS=Singulisphaera acidiphila (strain ATCC BAA-1392 / DSM 18658 / VKM B-2454 / MOB10) GN=Sinac_5126 PE=4 SV=1: Peptidase_M28 [Gemmataceae bacterium]
MSHGFGWLIGAVVLAAGGGASMWWITQSRSAVPPEAHLPVLAGADGADPAEPEKKTEFATGGDKGGDAVGVKFESDRALKYLKQLCDIGPRISASDGMKKQQEILEKHFKDLGATVTRQEFKAKQRSRKNPVEMVNLIVTWHPDKARRVVLTTHYDTRPIADQELLPGNWNKPFVSANDGTSGVALLMELGHHMKDLKSEFGVDFVFFDGEEYVFETPATGGGDKYFFGSEFFADEYAKSKDKRKFRYDAGLLFDLCAGKDAQLKVEQNSYTMAPKLVDQVWGVAKAVGAKSFKYEAGHEVLDDHIALNRAGIPTADVIDFDYPHWHKLSDTPDKISGEQMAEVAKVVTVWLQKIK